jgi:hypothetical protein
MAEASTIELPSPESAIALSGDQEENLKTCRGKQELL